jgi:hypothetical protein
MKVRIGNDLLRTLDQVGTNIGKDRRVLGKRIAERTEIWRE